VEREISARWADKALNRNFHEKHAVNQAVMSFFFPKEDLAVIDGERLFDDRQMVKIPEWKIDSKAVDKAMAIDGDLKLRFQTGMEAVKKDRDIVEVATSGVSSKNIWTSPEDWDWSEDHGVAEAAMIIDHMHI